MEADTITDLIDWTAHMLLENLRCSEVGLHQRFWIRFLLNWHFPLCMVLIPVYWSRRLSELLKSTLKKIAEPEIAFNLMDCSLSRKWLLGFAVNYLIHSCPIDFINLTFIILFYYLHFIAVGIGFPVRLHFIVMWGYKLN